MSPPCCEGCGNQISPVAVTFPGRRTEARAEARPRVRGLRAALGLIIAGAVFSLLVKGEPQLPSTSAGTRPEGRNAPSFGTGEIERQKARAEIVFELQQLYEQRGLNVQVSEGPNRELVLSSDLFKDIASRDEAIKKLVRDQSFKTSMCYVGFWELDTAYSKGLVSRDVTKRVSMDCPEEREMWQARRDKWASDLQGNFDEKSFGVKVIARGTTLVLMTGDFSGDQQQHLIRIFVAKEVATPQLCTIGFKRIETQGIGGSTHSATLPCPRPTLYIPKKRLPPVDPSPHRGRTV